MDHKEQHLKEMAEKISDQLSQILARDHHKMREFSDDLLLLGMKHNLSEASFVTACLRACWSVAIPAGMPEELFGVLVNLAKWEVNEAWSNNKESIKATAEKFMNLDTKVPN